MSHSPQRDGNNFFFFFCCLLRNYQNTSEGEGGNNVPAFWSMLKIYIFLIMLSVFCSVFNKTLCLTKHFIFCPYAPSFLCRRKLDKSSCFTRSGFVQCLLACLPWAAPSYSVTARGPCTAGPFSTQTQCFQIIFGARKVGLEKGNDEPQIGPVRESRKPFAVLSVARQNSPKTLGTLFSIRLILQNSMPRRTAP